MDFFSKLFTTADFQVQNRHGDWPTVLIFLHNVSDLLIWLAYLAIPALLLYYVHRRRGLRFPFIFWMFGGFIVCCGFTHFMEVVTFYTPLYRLAGLLKAATAAISLATVFALMPVIPRALSLRDPEELESQIAERIRAEQELAESSEFTRQIIANAREGIVVFDRQLHCIAWNPFMEELSGLPAAAVLGKHPLAMGGFFQDQETDALMESALAGQVVFCRDVPYAIPDTGRTGWCSPQLSPLCDAHSAVIGVIATVRDVTERKQFEQDLQQMHDELEERVAQRTAELARANVELRESEQRFRQLAENIPQVFWMSDPKTQTFLYVSPAYETVWGQSCQSAYEQPFAFLEAVHPDDRPSVITAMARHRRGEPSANDYRLVRPDGSVRWIWDRGFPIKDRGGEVYRVAGIAEDVTERKLAAERFRLAVEAAPNGMVMVDADGMIVLANSQMEQLFGYRVEELLGRPIELLVPERLRGLFPAYRESVLAAPQSRGLGAGRDLFGLHRNGTEVAIEIGLNPIPTDRGTFILASIIDITARKQAQQELRQAKDAAESANRAKGEFLANVSHEIRTPLNGIMGMTELVLDTELTPKQREYLRLVKQSSDSLLTVINDLLDFARIEAGKLDLLPEPFDLRATLDDILKALALRAHKKNLDLNCRVRPEVPDRLVGDANRLRQVIVNLIGNAIKFTEAGEVALEVAVEPEADSRVRLHFVVADTGIGIPEEKQRLIFEPFEQGDTSATRQYEGTGLGLAIASQLICLMGGQIWVQSAAGAGSRFHFTALFEHGPARAETAPRPEAVAEKPQRVEARKGRPLRVLLAEDNPVNQLMTVDLLEKQGHKVFVAANGKEALALREREPIDLLLLDVQMPEMSGFEVVAAIRTKERGGSRHLPIIAVTARAMKGDRDRCLAAGMDDYLSKPLRADELLAAIDRLTASRRSHATDNPRLRAKMARIFLDVYPQWLDKLRAALNQGDATALEHTAHTIKGSVSHFDDPLAGAAAGAALRLENLGEAKTLTGAAEVFVSLEEALRQLHPVLVRWSEQTVSCAVRISRTAQESRPTLRSVAPTCSSRSQRLRVIEGDELLDLARLEAQRHRPHHSRQHRHIVQFADHPFQAQPLDHGSAGQVDHL